MKQVRAIRTFHYNMQYNLYGVALLLSAAVAVYVYFYVHNVSGSLNMAIFPFLICVFFWGYFTGRPCLNIYPTCFEYRRYPAGRAKVVLFEDIVKIDIRGTEILVYCAALGEPVRIRSSCFSKARLPEVTEYFKKLSPIKT